MDAIDCLQIRNWKETRSLEEGDRGGHGPKTAEAPKKKRKKQKKKKKKIIVVIMVMTL